MVSLVVIIGTPLCRPATGWRQLWAVAIVLAGVAGGYLSYNFLSLFRRRELQGDG